MDGVHGVGGGGGAGAKTVGVAGGPTHSHQLIDIDRKCVLCHDILRNRTLETGNVKGS